MADEDKIRMVCDFTGLNYSQDKDVIVSALKAKNSDVTAVVNEYFNDEGKFRDQYTWSELPFQLERDGSLPQNNPSFLIEGPDEGPVIQGIAPAPSIPPSRPPSRANNRSPLGRIVDWAAEGAAGPPVPGRWEDLGANAAYHPGAPMSRAQEEEDLQRAIRESAADSGIPVEPMETGVTAAPAEDTALPFFGPAVRDHYDQSQWAVVPVSRDKPDPRPTDRKRAPEVPAFLRCRKDGSKHHIGSLLTIFHEIPLARNTLLEIGRPPATASYGINKFWWKGDPIVPADFQAVEQSGWETTPEPDFAHELHRLMAFLDVTDRSYGTADALADTRIVANRWNGTTEARFFEVLRDVFGDVAAPFCFSVETIPFFPHNFVGQQPIVDLFGLFELRLDSQSYDKIQNLYEAWDEVYWIDFHNMEEDDTFCRTAAITQPGEILTIEFSGDGLTHPIDIPADFYIDRYMADSLPFIKDTQLRIRGLKRKLEEVELAKREADTWEDPETGDKMSIRVMCETEIERYTNEDRWLRDDALYRKWHATLKTPQRFTYLPGGAFDHMVELTEEEEKQSAYCLETAGLMRKELEELEKKIQKYTEEINEILAEIRMLSSLRTEPDPANGWNPTRKYSLCGMATTENTMYIARRPEQNLIEIDDEAPPPSEQWWKLSYGNERADQNPVHISTTTLEEVRTVSYTETKKPILVYASDKAMETMPKTLPDALRNFVKFDNRYFKQEQIEQQPDEPPSGPPPPPPGPPPSMAPPMPMPMESVVAFASATSENIIRPTARLVRTTSSTAASVGNSSDTAMADDDDGGGMLGTEMTEISMTYVEHVEHHQDSTDSSSASTANIHTPSTLADAEESALPSSSAAAPAASVAATDVSSSTGSTVVPANANNNSNVGGSSKTLSNPADNNAGVAGNNGTWSNPANNNDASVASNNNAS